MRILIIPSWYPREFNKISGIFFQRQAEQLLKKKYDVVVLYPEQISLKKVFKRINKTIIKELENGVLTYRTKNINYFSRLPKFKKKDTEKQIERLYNSYLEDNDPPDIIHAHSCLYGGVAAVHLGEKYNIPVIVTEHSSKVGKGDLTGFEKKIFNEALNKCNRIITVSKELELSIKTNGRILTDIEVVPNSIEVKNYKSNKIYDEKLFTFGSLCFLNKNKNIDLLIQAFTKAFKNKNVELIIGGDGPEKKSLTDLVNKHEMSEQIKFTGLIKNTSVPEFLDEIDVFVSSSKYETFGVVIIEALASGKPVVSTRSGGPNSIINEHNGLLANVDDINDLSMKMQYIRENYKKYNHSEIIETTRREYDHEIVIEQIGKVYKGVVNNEYKT